MSNNFTKILPRYKNTIGRLPGLYYCLDTNQNIIDWNQELREVFGYSTQELKRMHFSQLFIEEDRDKVKKTIKEVLKGGKIQVEGRVFTQKGEVILTRWYGIPLKDGEGNLIGITGIGRDITSDQRTVESLRQSYVDLAETVSRVLGISDPYTGRHSINVAKLAQKVGRRMGLNKDRCLGLYIGGLLHDIGKVAIPQRILIEPGDLSDEEWALIRSHPKRGYEKILKKTPFPWPVGQMVLHHHERLDGSGYPDGLEGDELSIEVRILSLCDVVCAMSSRRPYRPPRSQEEVLKEVRKGAGVKYDSDVAEVILEKIENGEIPLDRS